MLSEIIQRNKEQFLNLCKSYGIKSLFVFGSAANDHFKETSDVDFVVELLEWNGPAEYENRSAKMRLNANDKTLTS